MAFQLMGNNEYPSHRMFELFMTPNDRFMYFNRMREMYRMWNWNMEQNYNRPWNWMMEPNFNQFWTTIKTMKNRYQINLDVQHFAPDEISVKMVDGYVVVEGEHDEKQDEHGFIARHFTRRYCLPEGFTAEMVESKLSSDGVLCITAKKFSPEAKNVRIVPVVQTGPIRKAIVDETPQTTETMEK